MDSEKKKDDEVKIIVIHKKNLVDITKHSMKGFMVGLGGVVIPLSLKSRKMTGVRKGLALGVLLGLFRMTEWISWRLGYECRTIPNISYRKLGNFLDQFSIAIAGALSTFCAIQIEPSVKNSILIIWLIIRAFRTKLPHVPGTSVFVMWLSAAQILSTWIRSPEEHAPSYVRFLNVHGGQPRWILQAVSRRGPKMDAPCSFLHPDQTCSQHAVSFWLAGMKRAFPVYLPIHILAFLFSKQKSPKHLVENMLRSCMFLSTYCTVAWFGSCLWFHWIQKGVHRKNLFMSASFAGLAVLLEHPKRRPELAAYCLTHALNSVWNHLRLRRNVRPIPGFSTLALIVSMAVILQHHTQQSFFLMKHLFGIEYTTDA